MPETVKRNTMQILLLVVAILGLFLGYVVAGSASQGEYGARLQTVEQTLDRKADKGVMDEFKRNTCERLDRIELKIDKVLTNQRVGN